MNDPIKYMLAGAAIAVGSAAITGLVIGWSVSQAALAPSKSIHSSAFSTTQPTGPVTRLKLPAQTAASILPPGQFTMPPPRQPGSSNIIIRPSSNSFPPPAAFQKAQDLPEVKKAREEFMEAQRRYSEAMKKAMGSGGGQMAVGSSQMGDGSGAKTGAGGQMAVGSSQMARGSGQPSAASGQPAQK